jgi:hypothetical protein
MPEGFADGVDDDTVYVPGLGLSLDGGVLSVDTEAVQQRVTGDCAEGSAMRVIHPDGSVTCEDVEGGTSAMSYTAGVGLYLSGDEFGISTPYRLPQMCADGQIAELDAVGGEWRRRVRRAGR